MLKRLLAVCLVSVSMFAVEQLTPRRSFAGEADRGSCGAEYAVVLETFSAPLPGGYADFDERAFIHCPGRWSVTVMVSSPEDSRNVGYVVLRRETSIDGVTAAQVEALRQMSPQNRLEALRTIEGALEP